MYWGPTTRSRSWGRGPEFSFTPSNPWIGVGWRKAEETSLDAGVYLRRQGIKFQESPVQHIHAVTNQLELVNGELIPYDYLLICTGPKLDFAAIKGLGPEGGFTPVRVHAAACRACVVGVPAVRCRARSHRGGSSAGCQLFRAGL